MNLLFKKIINLFIKDNNFLIDNYELKLDNHYGDNDYESKNKTYSIDEIRAYKNLLVRYNQNVLERARKKLLKLCISIEIVFIVISLLIKVPVCIGIITAFTILLYFITNSYMIKVFHKCNEKKRFLNRY